MKPYYEQDGVTIYHGDCREILAGLPADRLITDPVWPNADPRLKGADDPLGLLMEALALARVRTIVLQLGRASDPRILTAVPAEFPFLCASWLRYVPPSYRGRVLMEADLAYAFGEAVRSVEGRRVIPSGTTSTKGEMPRGHGRNRSSEVFQATQDRMAHPAARHLRHVRWLTHWFADEGDTIIDPFCGTGTTLVAAKDCGCPAIGIEIEERFCEIAVRRVAQGNFAFEEVGLQCTPSVTRRGVSERA